MAVPRIHLPARTWTVKELERVLAEWKQQLAAAAKKGGEK